MPSHGLARRRIKPDSTALEADALSTRMCTESTKNSTVIEGDWKTSLRSSNRVRFTAGAGRN